LSRFVFDVFSKILVKLETFIRTIWHPYLWQYVIVQIIILTLLFFMLSNFSCLTFKISFIKFFYQFKISYHFLNNLIVQLNHPFVMEISLNLQRSKFYKNIFLACWILKASFQSILILQETWYF
jgi:hypothetical protein